MSPHGPYRQSQLPLLLPPPWHSGNAGLFTEVTLPRLIHFGRRAMMGDDGAVKSFARGLMFEAAARNTYKRVERGRYISGYHSQRLAPLPAYRRAPAEAAD